MPRSQAPDASRRLAQATGCGNIEGVEDTLRDGRPDDESLVTASALGYADIVDLLLEAGVSATARGGSGLTALYVTAACGSPTIAQGLIDAGADVSTRTCKGDAPLHYFAQEGHTAGT